jgi:hypothetical protein
MSRKFLVSIDLNKNELQNAAIQNLATAPSSPVAGQIYYNTTDNVIYFWNGSAWVTPSASQITSGLLASRPAAGTAGAGKFYYATDNYLLYYSDGSTWQQVSNFGSVTSQTSYGAASANGTSTNFARADHTHGTPALGTATPIAITGTASAGTATTPSKEDHSHAFTPTQDLSMATFKLTNLGTPTADADAATKAYVDGVAQGLDVKDSVRAGTTTAGTLASSFANGSVIDGVTLDTGNRILIKNQATASENGIYTVNASGAPTRSTDMNLAAEFAGAFTFIEEGTTLADTGWVCTTNNPVTIGTTPITWSQFSGAGTYLAGDGLTLVGNTFNVGAGSGITVGADTVSIDTAVVVRKYAVSIGDGSATSYTITHNLGTRDVVVSVYENSGSYAEVLCDINHATTNTITALFTVAPTSNQYRVVVQA